MDNRQTGNLGENIAQRYLINNGYRVLERNHREGFDEIDIIATSPSGVLVFFEVKTVFNVQDYFDGLTPEDNLTGWKFKKMARAAQKFVSKNPCSLNEEEGWQIDFIAIMISSTTKYDLRHYKNI